MATDKKKIKSQQEIAEMLLNSHVEDVNVESEVKTSFISYAMAVNVSRAIPDVRDGMKPVHRRIIYAMDKLGLTNSGSYLKCAKIVGDVMGDYHPHGDSSIYDALVRMAQDFSVREMLVDGKGNFGSESGHKAAAMRYTEAKMSKIAAEMIRDIDKNVVNFIPNYDGRVMQPEVLPSRFPNILVNGSDGIAVGMATSIPPHNLAETIDATIALLDNPDIEVDELAEIIVAPDFPTGALIMGRAGIKKAYATGRGNVILRGRAEIDEEGRRITITELPYQVNKDRLIEYIADLVKQKKLEGISDIQDDTGKDAKLSIIIDLKKDADPNIVLNMLYKHTNLQTSISIILLAIVDRVPKILNLKEILTHYIAHQKEIIIRRTRFDLEKALDRQHIVEGLIIAQANIDEVIKIVRSSYERAETINRLCESFELSERQANAIYDMRLGRLNGLEVEKLNKEHLALNEAVADYRDIIANPLRVIEILREEMTEIKNRYGSPRRSEISFDYSSIDIEDLIEKEDVVITISHQGYVKRQPVSEYRAQRRGGVGISAHKTKEEDFVQEVYTVLTHDYLLFFTNKGKVYRIKAYEIPEASRTSKGRAVINILPIEADEKVNAVLTVPADYKNTESPVSFLMLATKQGLIKKTPIEEFDSIMKNGKIAIKLTEDDELISAQVTTGEDELLLASSGGKCIRFSEQNVRAMGRNTMGVKSIRLDKDERVVDMTVVNENSEVFTITENGFGKRTDIAEYRLQGRGGKGIKVGTLTDKTGNIVNLKLITEENDIMLIADSGVIIRVAASEISKIGRNTQGVRVMRLKAGKVVSVAVVPHADPEEEELSDPESEAVEE